MRSAFPGPFRSIAITVVPEAARLDEAGWAEVEAIIGRALDARPAAVRRQLGMLIRVIGLLALVRYGRRFASLDAVRRTALLERLQDARLLLLRRGVWGLRTLVFMGYYARPAAAAEIGYRAHPRGWEALQ